MNIEQTSYPAPDVDVSTLKLLRTWTNNWRQRHVSIYEHPTDATRVITVGVPISGGAAIVCDEPRSAFWSQLGMPRPR